MPDTNGTASRRFREEKRNSKDVLIQKSEFVQEVPSEADDIQSSRCFNVL